MENFNLAYKGKKIIITGHTGFKGSWLTLWLSLLGADIVGISKDVPTDPSHFELLNLKNKINKDFRVDISKSLDEVIEIFRAFQPDFVFHLAAEALVGNAYENPINAFATNTLGSLHICEAIRKTKNDLAAILITSDKVYDNQEWYWGYKETDTIGGPDPYSASKGMAEIGINSYFRSFFSIDDKKLLATVRAGNVIGGGDWAKDRIVPDCIKQWKDNKVLYVRNPKSTRPWQHVLEPLGGYLLTGKLLKEKKIISGESFNFGPSSENNFTVEELINTFQKNWTGQSWKTNDKENKLKEAKLLSLNIEKSKFLMNWSPVLTFEETANMTIDWYRKFHENNLSITEFSENQIKSYIDIANSRMQKWIC